MQFIEIIRKYNLNIVENPVFLLQEFMGHRGSKKEWGDLWLSISVMWIRVQVVNQIYDYT